MSIPPERQKHKKSFVWHILKIALAFALTGFILSKISFNDLGILWQRLSVTWLLAYILVLVAGLWTMARRYWMLVDQGIPFGQFFRLVVLQTVVGNVIATTAGAVSYIAVLHSQHKIQVRHGILSLLIARFGDMLILFLALLLSSMVLWPQIAGLHLLVIVLLASMVGIGILSLGIAIFHQPFLIFSTRFLHYAQMERIPLIEKFAKTLTNLTYQESRRFLALFRSLVVYSSLLFLLGFSSSYCSVELFAVPIGPWPILFMLSLTQLMAIVPIQVFGGLGVYDVTLMYLYGLFGIGESEIAPVIIGWRILFYFLNFLWLLYLPLNTLWQRTSVRKINRQQDDALEQPKDRRTSAE